MSNDDQPREDPFSHLRQRASERADRTVERLRAAIAALRAANQKITAESLKQMTRQLEPGFAGLSFQVIRRNPRAYELYQQAADAFTRSSTADEVRRKRRRARRVTRRAPHAAYDPLQRLDKRDLVRRIRTLEEELEAEHRRRGALAYDQQALLARLLRLETEIILLDADRSHPG
ncbi:MAG: hypothetical protein JOZ81_20710 [Chloroflexi bacterium]|nr:hypothetical protein [Chloroflexota bacterium]